MEFILYIFFFLASIAATVFLLYYYAHKNTPRLAYIASFAGWFSGFMLVGVLPYDIYVVFFAILHAEL